MRDKIYRIGNCEPTREGPTFTSATFDVATWKYLIVYSNLTDIRFVKSLRTAQDQEDSSTQQPSLIAVTKMRTTTDNKVTAKSSC